ncbi:hypothetical protein KDW_17970 [Dictyobacter vulcani]|uniref:histidine kinase n=1 Tax=Dictyobacter vulcani TaxID=2607529 RepID=A0A5J4KIN0_9CHLR|nr:sensor histidine kinase [Dictyobacter vulcani]GER87635.1 hypothetical protein KDW_17970 [Dictyobacter vulcani]
MSLLKRLRQRLQWKLTLSALLTTVITVLLIELITVLFVLSYFFAFPTRIWENNMQSLANQATPFFVNDHPDRAELNKWLQISNNQMATAYIQSPNSFIAIVDQRGNVLVSRGGNLNPQLSVILSPVEQQHLRDLLNGKLASSNWSQLDGEHVALIVAPIKDGTQIKGALILRSDQLAGAILSSNLGNFLPLLILNLVVITILAAITGMVAGYLMARSFTRRFQRLSLVVDQWSRGDFSVQATDRSEDELGQLMRQLNRMAEKLQQLLKTRQQLATLEERNRLARDLHDSVKQQVFVLAMQVGVIRILLGRDVAAANQRLNDMEQLVRDVQKELTSLIRELRPIALDGKQLGQALLAYVRQWQDQTWIATDMQIDESCAVSADLEDALFRITQEALSNAARHSNASHVNVQLYCRDEQVVLMITDNGKGFQLDKLEKRGVGLLSMQERIQALGGKIEIDSNVDKGTRVQVRCSNKPVSIKAFE